MKTLKDKVAILEGDVLEDLVDEIAYLRIMINSELKPTTNSLENINIKLDKTIKNFDANLASKISEVINKIDINFIHQQVIIEVVKKFEPDINRINDLSKLSIKIERLLKIFHARYFDIQNILDTYEKRILTTKYFSRFVGFWVITLTFATGAISFPLFMFLLNYFAKGA